MVLTEGNTMKIQSNFLKSLMFASLLAGATFSIQNVKADTVTDSDAAENKTNTTVVADDQSNATSDKDNQQTTNQTVATTDSSNTTSATQTSYSENSAQNNYYQYVNKNWLNDTKVSDEQPAAGAIIDAQNQMNAKVQLKFENYLNGTEHTNDPTMQKAISFYKMFISKNYQSTNDVSADAFQGIAKKINTIDGLQNVADLSNNLNSLQEQNLGLPFGIKVDTDENNPNLRALYFYGLAPLLMSDEGESSNNFSESQDTIGSVLTSAGIPFSTVQSIIINTKKFDQILAKYQTTADKTTDHQQADYAGTGINRVSNYLPVNFLKFADSSNFLDLDDYVENAVGMTPGYVYNMSPSYFENIDKIINPDNFNLLKSWMISNYVLKSSSYIASLQKNFSIIKGESTKDFQQRLGYFLTSQAFSNEFSKYFGDVFLDRETKQAVTKMANDLIASYRKEIQNSSWLSSSTKKAAIEKLNSITVNVGYPRDSYSFYNQINVQQDDDFFEAYDHILAAKANQPFKDYNLPATRNQWGDLSALSVNANYSNSQNAMFISTGILTAPFFDKNQTDSQNYGGLGTIIGHELSHAFDGNGSLYDKNGLFKNWWTANDLKVYQEKLSQMVDQLDQTTYQGQKLNGTDKVNESLADNAGLNVAELALANKSDANFEQFFKSYAAISRHKQYYDPNVNSVEHYDEIQDMLKDPHAPFPIRVNMNLSNNDLFYQTYNVKSNDKMWRDPADRFDFWN